MTAAQVIDNEICFKHTEYDSIVELFNSRAQMHKRVWQRRAATNRAAIMFCSDLSTTPSRGLIT